MQFKYAKDRPRYNQLWDKAPMSVNGKKIDPLRHTLVARKKQNIFSLKAGSDMLRLSPITFWCVTFPSQFLPSVLSHISISCLLTSIYK